MFSRMRGQSPPSQASVSLSVVTHHATDMATGLERKRQITGVNQYEPAVADPGASFQDFGQKSERNH